MKQIHKAARLAYGALSRYLARESRLAEAAAAFPVEVDGLVARSAFGKSYDLRDRRTCHEALAIAAGDRVLDAGGGHNPLKRADVVADIDDHETSHRNGNPLRLFPHQKFVRAPLERLPFADREFDYVFCSQVLEHVDDPAAACSELQRVAKRGLIDTPRSSTDLVFSHPDHKWLIDFIDGTLYFRPKPLRTSRSVLFKSYGLAAWNGDREVMRSIDFLYRCVSNNHFEWEGSFRYKVLPGWQ